LGDRFVIGVSELDLNFIGNYMIICGKSYKYPKHKKQRTSEYGINPVYFKLSFNEMKRIAKPLLFC